MYTPFSRTLRSLSSQRYGQNITTLIVLLLMLGIWLVWFFSVQVKIYEISDQARLEVDVSVHPIEVPLDGKIIESRIDVGKQVNRNDFLLRLDSQGEELKLFEFEAQHESLGNEVLALKKEIEAVEEVGNFDAKEEKISVQEAKARYEESEVAVKFAGERLRRIEKLYKNGQIPEFDLLKTREEREKILASSRVFYEAFARAKQGRSKSGSNIDARLKRLQYELTQDEGKLEIARATIVRIKHDIERHTIRAPVSGRIGEMSGTQVGSIVKAGDQLGVIIPSGKLKAVAYFRPSDAIGRLRKNQTGRLSIDGFPWMQYGSLPIIVSKVSGEVRDGLIKVELDVDRDAPTLIPIQHGMPAVAEIEIEKLSPAMLTLRSVGKLVGGISGSQNSTSITAEH